MDLFEIVLSVLVILAAGFSFRYGFYEGLTSGAECALDVMIEDGHLSRFVNKDGDIEFCGAGVMNNRCPKCGFHEGDNCGEHSKD